MSGLGSFLVMKVKIILLLIIMGMSQSVFAIKVSGLYQTTVNVVDESESARNKVLKQALTQVLVKLTSDINISSSSQINFLFENPKKYIKQYRYKMHDSDEKNTDIELQIVFDAKALNTDIRSQGVAIWGDERPSIVVWLAAESDLGRHIVSFEDSPEYIDLMTDQAANRGIVLLFPLLDLEDNSKINVSDIWGSFREPVMIASKRYNADIILTGKLYSVQNEKKAIKWSVFIKNKQFESWVSKGSTVEGLLRKGIDNLVDKIAPSYVHTNKIRPEYIEFEVVDINNIDDYARVIRYLENLQSINSVHVKKISDNKVSFELASLGNVDSLDKTIGLGRILERVSDIDGIYQYRLLVH